MRRRILGSLAFVLLLFARPGVAPAAAGDVPPARETARVDQPDVGTAALADLTAE